MQSRSIVLGTLLLICSTWMPADAQVFESRPGLPTFGGISRQTAMTSFPEAKPYGTGSRPLPGMQVLDASKIQGKWLWRETRTNVDFEGVRVPTRVTTMTLELKTDGSYTLDYTVYWGLANSSKPEDQQGGLIAKETGRFAVSGSVLLLEAQPLDVIRQGKFTRKTEALPADKRAHIVRLDGNWLNIAGPCRSYQVETVCARNPTVWFSLLKDGARATGKR